MRCEHQYWKTDTLKKNNDNNKLLLVISNFHKLNRLQLLQMLHYEKINKTLGE